MVVFERVDQVQEPASFELEEGLDEVLDGREKEDFADCEEVAAELAAQIGQLLDFVN